MILFGFGYQNIHYVALYYLFIQKNTKYNSL